jgi:hypothetical protein
MKTSHADWVGNRSVLPKVAWAWLIVPLALAEFAKAHVAAHRYERLKYSALESQHPAFDNARRIYLEFYSDTHQATAMLLSADDRPTLTYSGLD